MHRLIASVVLGVLFWCGCPTVIAAQLDSREPAFTQSLPIPALADAASCVGQQQCPLPPTNADKTPKPAQPLSGSITKNNSVGSAASDENKAMALLKSEKLIPVVFGFWLFGLLLAFTPCVLPLILLISGFLGGRTGELSKRKIVTLSFTYILSLSVTYALAGMIAAVFGVHLQAYFQQPWILILSSLFLVLLALSLLGLYKLQIPVRWQRVAVRYNKFQANYTHTQVALMGIFATLIVSPCVAAPLVGILGYIGVKGDAFLGALALFMVGIGVGTPLLMVAILGVKMLPQTESWQEAAKTFFGLLLMALAIWLFERVISRSFESMLLWSGLVIFGAIYMWVLHIGQKNNLWKLWKALSVMVLVYGVSLFVGALLGNVDPLNPFQKQASLQRGHPKAVDFQHVANLTELQKAFSLSIALNKPVLLSFYADWCSACAAMEENVYSDQKVKAILSKFILLRVDLTDITAENRELTKYFNVVGPPAVLFFNGEGRELERGIFGEVDADTFLVALKGVLKQEGQ